MDTNALKITHKQENKYCNLCGELLDGISYGSGFSLYHRKCYDKIKQRDSMTTFKQRIRQ